MPQNTENNNMNELDKYREEMQERYNTSQHESKAQNTEA